MRLIPRRFNRTQLIVIVLFTFFFVRTFNAEISRIETIFREWHQTNKSLGDTLLLVITILAMSLIAIFFVYVWWDIRKIKKTHKLRIMEELREAWKNNNSEQVKTILKEHPELTSEFELIKKKDLNAEVEEK